MLVDNGRFQTISDVPLRCLDARVIDVRGRVLMPGLCDAHVHTISATNSFLELQSWSPVLRYRAHDRRLQGNALPRLHHSPRRWWRGIGASRPPSRKGSSSGSASLYCGKALSQTGGHGDMRAPGENFEQCICCPGLGRICDGVDEVRRAVRDEVRKGATHIKLMLSGGIASPTDRITSTQFSIDEIRAAVEEAEAASIYCMGHAYTARAINRALECGVRSIEHGNLARRAPVPTSSWHKGAWLVPTLVDPLHHGARREPATVCFLMCSPRCLRSSSTGTRALEIATRRGVKIAFGTDLLGTMHDRQSEEFLIRAEIQKPIDVIRRRHVHRG